jgi:valyl-tRNA synthetase
VDAAAEVETGALLDLVGVIRNARSEAKLDPAAWLPVDVALPAGLEPVFAALRPALERLVRARPLAAVEAALIHADAAGGLAVVAGEIEAVVRPVAHRDDETAARDRARVEKELADAERQLGAARARLADERFMEKAPPAVGEGVRTREAELAARVTRIRARRSA